MIKDRLRELNIKLTELSDYVKVSRPTLYKYIESYEKEDFKNVRPDVLGLFRYLENPSVKREQAITYMLSSSTEEVSDGKDAIRKYLLNPNASQSKIELIQRLIATDVMDGIVPYLNNCIDVLSQEDITDDQIHQIARFVNLRSDVTRNVQLSPEELEKAKNTVRKSNEHA